MTDTDEADPKQPDLSGSELKEAVDEGLIGEPSDAAALTIQLAYLAAVNTIVLGCVWIMGQVIGQNAIERIPTHGFVLPEFVVIVGGYFLSLTTIFIQGADVIRQDQMTDARQVQRILRQAPQGVRARWLLWRDKVLKAGVLLLSALMVLALDRLVYGTGGGLHSPFMPLLEAPAVLGPFLARKPPGVLLSAAAVSSAMVVEIFLNHDAANASYFGRVAHALMLVIVVGSAAAASAIQKLQRTRSIGAVAAMAADSHTSDEPTTGAPTQPAR